ncbi:MAG: glycosyl transferase [Chloroflexota bacterium]|nr:glycosyl transferase family 36 [Chloroflexota bacterium]NOG61865.1 glycosyl transferase family 36 [Chloroflexota bacterium]GIK62546.1 MAG: glycosyl transferase [Chloroflexota bacterium]
MTQLPNKYGYFSDDGLEYVITCAETPMPWVNVLSNGDYGFVISQAGSGYSWRTHASLNRITRWDQDLIRDEWGKYLYIRDTASGEFWSPTFQPCGEKLQDYRVRHGMGYSIIEGQQAGIASTVTYFVPEDDPCEIWVLRLKNEGNTPRQLQLFTYFEWLLGNAPDWHREFHRTFIETSYHEQGVLLATKVMWELPVPSKTHWNLSWPYMAFHSASLMPSGYDADKRDFLGRHGSPHNPAAVRSGHSYQHTGRWGDAIGSLRHDLTLAPGEEREIVYTLGAADNPEQALALSQKYRDGAVVHSALETVKKYWHGITQALHIETPDPALNVFANGWLQYQAISGRIKARTAYYQTGGAYGFRDQLQDSLVWLLLGQPEKTLAQIHLHAAHQYQDGIVLHWWHPIADTGMRSDYSDDLLWIPFVTLYYMHETGDFACLDAEIPYYDGGVGTLREHCMRSFDMALSRRSPRGLPYILKADWNDGLNAVGAEGKGESVWMGHFLHYLLREWANLPIVDAATKTRFEKEAEAVRAAVNQHAWDGAWYWRATTDAGELVGSHQSPEGQIFLNAQTWAVLADTADRDRARLAMASTRDHLYSPYGPLLLAPAYSIPDPHIGYLSRYAPGTRENGGVYCHAACWAVLAERKQNGMVSAYQVWRSFCPPVRGEDPDAYSAEPYVMPGNVAGPLASQPGQGGWSWYTGSAAWYLRALTDGVLGIEGRVEGLRVKAELPPTWKQYWVKRQYRGAVYDITVRRAHDSEKAVCRVNGAEWQGEFLPIAKSGTTQSVEIILPA